MPQLYADGPVTILVIQSGQSLIEYCCHRVSIDHAHRMRQYYPEGMLQNPTNYEIFQDMELTITGKVIETAKTTPLDYQLAYAILEGNKDAVWPLIDYLLETRSRQP